MRLGFLGTPAAAVPSLRALVAAGHDVALVVTGPDARRGRGGQFTPTAVKQAALDLGLAVGHSLDDLAPLAVERAVVVAFGSLIPAAMLARTPMLNVHFSLLPRWRGAAPVERAILAGDLVTGVAVMSLEAELDTGAVHLVESVEVGEKTASQLTEELARVGAGALVRVLASRDLLEHPRAQTGEATYAKKVTAETFRLRPTASATQILRTVRLERAFTFVGERRLKILRARRAATLGPTPGWIGLVDDEVVLAGSDGSVTLDLVQPEGSRAMPARAWWAGARFAGSTTWG